MYVEVRISLPVTDVDALKRVVREHFDPTVDAGIQIPALIGLILEDWLRSGGYLPIVVASN